MAYVPGFDYDIFISYARANNVPYGNQLGWVSEFYLALKSVLKGGKLSRTPLLNPNDLEIFLDTKDIVGNEYWDSTLERAVRSSAIMISILSRSYSESPYCLQELNEFCNHGDIRVEVNGRSHSRVFKIFIENVSRASQPPQIVRNDGYDFYSVNPLNEQSLELRQNDGQFINQNYKNLINNLATQVKRILEEMLKKPEEHIKTDAPVIYLAEVAEAPDDLAEKRSEIKSTLIQRGVVVLPTQGLSNSSADIRQIIRDDLARASFYIHLLGPYHKRVSSDNGDSLSRIQHEAATEAAKEKYLGRLVWIEPDFEISTVSNQSHREFLESLVSDRDSDSPMEVVREPSVEKLKDLILKKVFPDAVKEKPPLEKTPISIYVSHLPEDTNHAKEIAKHLKEKKHTVFRSFSGDNKEDRDSDHRKRLKKCGAVMILYGQDQDPNRLEIRDRIDETDDAAKRRKRNPFVAKSFCKGPPTPKKDIEVELNENDWIEIDCENGIDTDSFEEFFEALSK